MVISYLPILKEALTEEYSKERNGDVHISDLVNCPRQRIFKILEPTPLTDRELNFFSSGRGIHSALENLIMHFPERFEHEKDIRHEFKPLDKSLGEKIVVEGHVDMYDKMYNVPIEAKTRRVAKADKAKSFHYEQLEYYQAILNAPEGVILYQLLINFGDNPWVEFPSTMTETERKEQLKKLEREAESFYKARVKQDPSLARHVMDDPTFNSWLCWEEEWKDKKPTGKKTARCPYYEQCLKMNQKRSGSDAGNSPDLLKQYGVE